MSPFSAIAPGAYGVILADPPWSFAHLSAKGQRKAAQAAVVKERMGA